MLRFGSIPTGYVARIEGRGTMLESPGFLTFVSTILESEPQTSVALDLEECEYLDSTFLGCVLALHRRFAAAKPPRFMVIAGDDTRTRLLTPTRMDLILVLLTDCDSPQDWLDIPDCVLGQREFGEHVLQCHQRLAEIEGPQAQAFRRVIDELARDLNGSADSAGH